MSYLDRLRALDAIKHAPEQLTKLPKAPSVGFVSDQGKRFSPISAPSFDPAGLQRVADERNARGIRKHSTDRFCACGSLAESGYPDGRGGTTWRCWRCFPVLGRA
jgi:hypothetical protein